MAFPTTPILTNFTQANGALDSNWTSPLHPSATGTPTVNTNMVIGPSGDNSAYWDTSTFGPDTEVYCTIPSGATSSVRANLILKAQNIGTGTFCCYLMVVNIDGDSIGFYRWYNNAEEAALLEETQTFNVGDVVGFKAYTSGSDINLEAYRNGGLIWTDTDAGILGTKPLLFNAGYIGFWMFGSGSTTRAIDDFGGGTVATQTATSFLLRGA